MSDKIPTDPLTIDPWPRMANTTRLNKINDIYTSSRLLVGSIINHCTTSKLHLLTLLVSGIIINSLAVNAVYVDFK